MSRRPAEQPDSGWCQHCKEPCEGKWSDEGIGAYEYWGQRCVDTKWVCESECCGSTILDQDPLACESCGEHSTKLDEGGYCPTCAKEEENEEANQNTDGARLSGQEPEVEPMPSGETRWNFTGSRLSSH